MIQKIRVWLRNNVFFRKLVGYHLASSGLFDNYFINYKVSDYWDSRIKHVLSSSDNAFIPKVPDAGKITGGKQVMHNGLKVHLGSYYGPEYAKMFLLSKGVHEPQEERYFAEVLKSMPANALMIELGSFWSFYSMWFHKEVVGASNIMVEPDEFNIGQGKRNFKLNKMKGDFVQAFVGDKMEGDMVSVDGLVQQKQIRHINILHSDIQGFELDMLNGAQHALANNIVDYIFISTHSNELHYGCIEKLKSYSYTILSSIDLDESYSEDGLIVAASSLIKDPPIIELSKNNSAPVQ